MERVSERGGRMMCAPLTKYSCEGLLGDNQRLRARRVTDATYSHHAGGEDREAKGHLPEDGGERLGPLAAQLLVVDVEGAGVKRGIAVPDHGVTHDGIRVRLCKGRRMAVDDRSLLGHVDLHLGRFAHLCLCHFCGRGGPSLSSRDALHNLRGWEHRNKRYSSTISLSKPSLLGRGVTAHLLISHPRGRRRQRPDHPVRRPRRRSKHQAHPYLPLGGVPPIVTGSPIQGACAGLIASSVLGRGDCTKREIVLSRRSICLPTSFFGSACGRHGRGHGLKLAHGTLENDHGHRHHDSAPGPLNGDGPRGELGKWRGRRREKLRDTDRASRRCEPRSCSRVASPLVLGTSYLPLLRALSSTSVSPPGSL